MPGPDKSRLDQELVTRGLVVSRARARDLILRGEVQVDGVVAAKPSQRVGEDAQLFIRPGAGDYVSRGALKLRAGLDHFALEPRARVALDIGASTGGFTEALVERGAAKVYAIDNGHDQLHPDLRDHPRVISVEGMDARRLTRTEIFEPIGAIVADVSFISLTKVLPAALALAAPECWLVALVKPQFETAPDRIPKDGVITDPRVHADAVALVDAWLRSLRDWQVLGTIESPIKGGDGNTEFLIGAVHAH